MTTTTPELDPLGDDALSAARSTLPIYVVADSPDGQVLSHSGDYPEDDTQVWLADGGSDAETRPMGDLYAEYGDDLVAYAEPEEFSVAAALYDTGVMTREQVADEMGVTAAQGAPERTADGEVVINPDAPPDPKLALSTATQDALNAIPARRAKAEADGDTAEVEALDRYAAALMAGKTEAEARKAGWPADARPVTAALGNAAMDTIEAFLDEAERVVAPAVVAALGPYTGPPVPIPPVTQRMAVGGNEDAQGDVVEAFEAHYRPDLAEFIDTVLGARPPDDTPEHDAVAWDALAAEARLWHAKRAVEAVTAAPAAPRRPAATGRLHPNMTPAQRAAFIHKWALRTVASAASAS